MAVVGGLRGHMAAKRLKCLISSPRSTTNLGNYLPTISCLLGPSSSFPRVYRGISETDRRKVRGKAEVGWRKSQVGKSITGDSPGYIATHHARFAILVRHTFSVVWYSIPYISIPPTSATVPHSRYRTRTAEFVRRSISYAYMHHL